MQKTLVILKPSCLQRGLVGEVTHRFEQKGLRLAGMKMCQLTDDQMSLHYAQHAGKPFFQQLKDAMMVTPVIVCCYEGVDAVEVVRQMAGATNGRKAFPELYVAICPCPFKKTSFTQATASNQLKSNCKDSSIVMKFLITPNHSSISYMPAMSYRIKLDNTALNNTIIR